MTKIVVDRAIPFIEGVFEPYATVQYMDGKDISNGDLTDADALVIRTRTRCDAALLHDTAVRLIATATIGTDHIDFDYCRERGIYVQNAAGCNAGGVMNYVFSALYGISARKARSLTGATFGIIGVGAVGRRVEQMARYLGFKVYRCDPPRAAAEGADGFCSQEELLRNCQIVTMHVPLDAGTRGMADDGFFAQMLPGAVFINSARGEIVDDEALLRARPKLGAVIIDTWNGEPRINKALMDKVAIATPHIAGYSYQGKQNGTAAAVRAVARFFGFTELYEFFPVSDDIENLGAVKLDLRGMSQGEIASVFQYNYPIFTDDFMFRVNPDSFEYLRTNYKYRREFYVDL